MEYWKNGKNEEFEESKGLRIEEWKNACPVKCDVGAISTGEYMEEWKSDRVASFKGSFPDFKLYT